MIVSVSVLECMSVVCVSLCVYGRVSICKEARKICGAWSLLWQHFSPKGGEKERIIIRNREYDDDDDMMSARKPESDLCCNTSS